MIIGFIVSFLLLGGGLALIILSIVQGKCKFGLFIIFPWISTSDPLGMLGVLLLVGGFIALMVSISLARFTFELGNYEILMGDDETFSAKAGVKKSTKQVSSETTRSSEDKSSKKKKKVESNVGGAILLGPIPIVFGSNKKVSRGMVYIMLIVTVIMVAIFLLSLLVSLYGT